MANSRTVLVPKEFYIELSCYLEAEERFMSEKETDQSTTFYGLPNLVLWAFPNKKLVFIPIEDKNEKEQNAKNSSQASNS